MGVITDLLLAIPIGIIYNMIIHESADILNNKFDYKDRVQKSLLIISGGGLIALTIAFFFLSNSFENTAIRYGLFFGSFLLLFHSIVYNWQTMQNDTRIIIMILTLCILIWYSYMLHSKKHNKNHYSDDSNNHTDTDGTIISQLLPLTSYEQYKQHKKYNVNDIE